MNLFDNFNSIEKNGIEASAVAIKEKMEAFNKFFTSKVTPESGVYGVVENIKDNGIVKKIGKNELGHALIEYFDSYGKLYLRRENLGNHQTSTTYFDDNGTDYLKSITKLENNLSKTEKVLTPNITVKKGNFTAEIDAFGRPVLNKISDLTLKNGERESLNGIQKHSYRSDDHRGHIIADDFGGPASQENVIAQTSHVNQSKFAQVENKVRELKAQGKSVDYEVKTNYSGTDKRPTSFEPKITADGQEVELSSELKKIYNEADKNLSTMKKAGINASEKYGLAHELGMKNAAVAAGITMTVSTVENVSSFLDGEISAEEMVTDIVEDTAVAGALGYGTTFVTTAASQAMSNSSKALISEIGNSCLPAAVVSFGVESYDDISDFAKGKIDGAELAYNLGENAASVAGSMVGGAIGGSVASLPGAIVGGSVGCALAVEAYKTAVELGTEGAEMLADKAQELANEVVDTVKDKAPQALNDVKNAFSDFKANVHLPFSLG